MRSVSDVKSNAVGLDDIPLKFIKMHLPVLLPYVTNIFNTILPSSIHPDVWKVAKIVPVHKGPAKLPGLRKWKWKANYGIRGQVQVVHDISVGVTQ